MYGLDGFPHTFVSQLKYFLLESFFPSPLEQGLGPGCWANAVVRNNNIMTLI